MVKWVENHVIEILIFIAMCAGLCLLYNKYKEQEQLVKDYMIEYNVDRPTAERRIRIDNNCKKDYNQTIIIHK